MLSLQNELLVTLRETFLEPHSGQETFLLSTSDIFISIDRVIENAESENVHFEYELKRVLAHGLLHLIGFNDKTIEEQQVMREKEEAYLSLQLNK